MRRSVIIALFIAGLLPVAAPAHNLEPALESANQEIQQLRKEVYDLRREVEAMKKILSLQPATPQPAERVTLPAVPALRPMPKMGPDKKPVKVVRKPEPALPSDVDFPALVRTLNHLTAQYRNTRDPNEKLMRLGELSVDARDALNDKQIALTFTVRDARPRGSGIAEIWVSGPKETSLTGVDKRYISITPFKWIRVKMSEAQALNLRPGETLHLSGKALFFPQRKGDIGLSTDTQQIFTIHILNSANAIGTLTLQQYKATIGLLTFPGL